MKMKKTLKVLLLGGAVLATSPGLPKPAPVLWQEPPSLDAQIHAHRDEALRAIRSEARQGLSLSLPEPGPVQPTPAVAAAGSAER